ncbi:MAG: hypothetical protein HY200_08240 [Nitrospirae bacterium]|nr:hypothetical protein [Nitrospirota bacterium]
MKIPFSVTSYYNDHVTKRKPNPKELLLAGDLSYERVSAILSPVGIKDIKKGDMNLQLIADDPRSRLLLSEIIVEFLDSLSRSPDPDQALNYFERFTRMALNKANLLSYLKDSPYTVWLLAKVFGSSPFMSEVLIRYPHYLYWIAESQTLDGNVPKKNLAGDFKKTLRNLKSKEKKIEMLCVLKHKELLRIGVRDLLQKASLEETISSLSVLAEVVLENILRISEETVKRQYGVPKVRRRGGEGERAAFVVLAVGKLGGGELNFSSDVDLIFLYESDQGVSSGNRKGLPHSMIPNKTYFTLLSQEMIAGLNAMTSKGFLYRVDLRLRPEGRSGEITSSFTRFRKYYEKRGESWEKLALLKAWPVAGEMRLGEKFLRLASRFIYQSPFSTIHFSEVSKIKEEIDNKMSARGKSFLHVKLGIGGIREVEFIVQCLQIFYGKKYPEIRDRQTLGGLRKLYGLGVIPMECFGTLTDGYVFLRKVENSLQMVHENQTHTLPEGEEEFQMAALRLDYRDNENETATVQFAKDYKTHTGRIHRIFEDLFNGPESSALLKFPR